MMDRVVHNLYYGEATGVIMARAALLDDETWFVLPVFDDGWLKNFDRDRVSANQVNPAPTTGKQFIKYAQIMNRYGSAMYV